MRAIDLTIGFPGKPVLSHLDFAWPEKGAVAVMAPSGGGKTTLLRTVAGLLPPLAGKIEGTAGKKIAFLFQEDRLLPWLSARKNVELAGGAAAAQEWLRAMEIEDMDVLPSQMSGGMRRRVALARALSFGGDILILDEPFKGLDLALRERIAGRIRGGAPFILMAVHDPEEARLMGAEIAALQGREDAK